MVCRKDGDGNYIPENDPTILDQHSLRRRIDLGQWFHSGKGLSQGAFQLSSKKYGPNPGMSTDWIEFLKSKGLPVNDAASGGYAVGAIIPVAYLRAVDGTLVGHTPEEVTPNEAHSDVWGPVVAKESGRKKLLRDATYFVIGEDSLTLQQMNEWCEKNYSK